MRFRNPTNGYVMRGGGVASILWAFLFGPLYFIARGGSGLDSAPGGRRWLRTGGRAGGL